MAKSKLEQMKEAVKKGKQSAAAADPPAPPKSAAAVDLVKKPPSKKLARSPKARDDAHRAKGRLPNGSKFFLRWGEVDGRWFGELSVPVYDSNGETCESWLLFNWTADGVFRLLTELDDQYRAWVNKNKKESGNDPKS